MRVPPPDQRGKLEDDYNETDRRAAGVLRALAKHWLVLAIGGVLAVLLRSCLHA